MRTYYLMKPYYMFLLIMVTVFSLKAFSESESFPGKSTKLNPWTKLNHELVLKKKKLD